MTSNLYESRSLACHCAVAEILTIITLFYSNFQIWCVAQYQHGTMLKSVTKIQKVGSHLEQITRPLVDEVELSVRAAPTVSMYTGRHKTCDAVKVTPMPHNSYRVKAQSVTF